MHRSPVAASLSVLLIAIGLVVSACGGSGHSMGSMSGDDMGGGMGGGMMGDHDKSTPVAEGARRVEVGATSFKFDPDRITVAVGEDVAIVLSSDDLLHDFTVDEIDVHVSADRGETAEGGLRAEKVGDYTYYCTVAGHREAGMAGTLTVEAR